MPDRFDLVIRGGTLVDGTGAPRVTGDVAIRAGRIAALGAVEGEAAETLDATGAVVAPGFVDIHTHYDAQVFWDNRLSPSPWHGVTTVVMGNCGFGVAPTRATHRDLILRTLESVEGMSLAALQAGLGEDWPFESFPECLGAIEARGSAINVAALVGHTPVRTHVLGEAAVEREASEDEIRQMERLVREALEAGAVGFASSKATTHVGYDGHPVPSRAAAFEEIARLAECLRDFDTSVFQVTIGPGLAFEEFAQIQQRCGRPVSWTALLAGFFGPDGHRDILERHAKLQAEGIPVVPQVACRPLVTEFQWKAPFPLESLSVMKPVSAADFAGRKVLYADASFRAALRERLERSRLWDRFTAMVVSDYEPDAALCERSLAEIAEDRGAHPVDVALDLALETELEARFRLAVANSDDEAVAELLQHPASMLGLSDAGAHASQLCDAGAPTTLLGKWVRERGVLSLEEGVRQLTGQPAEIFGIRDRGRLEVGLAADVTVFDPETVGCEPVRRVHDFPAGADRLVADATGIQAVIVNGTCVRQDGRDGDARLPGRVLRGGRAQ
ncbi:MAG: amidohydrolase family protein [Proteobacteria bacterium]|nr:amidohydrolase family protein [Pseudomonadota bacterium]